MPEYETAVVVLNAEQLRKSVDVLMNCEHGHWFAVQKDEKQIHVNRSGLQCLDESGIFNE